MAVEVGFEPTEDLRLHTLSRRAPSATRRLHRGRAHRTEVLGGVLAGECGALLREFFAQRRHANDTGQVR